MKTVKTIDLVKLNTILTSALAKKGIVLKREYFKRLFDLFLESEPDIDQTKQPITKQVEEFAVVFLDSSSAQKIWNDRSSQYTEN